MSELEIILVAIIFWMVINAGSGKSKRRSYDRPDPDTNPPDLGNYGISLEPRGSHDADPFKAQDPK